MCLILNEYVRLVFIDHKLGLAREGGGGKGHLECIFMYIFLNIFIYSF